MAKTGKLYGLMAYGDDLDAFYSMNNLDAFYSMNNLDAFYSMNKTMSNPTHTQNDREIMDLLDEAKKDAPTQNKIIEITKQRLGRIPERGLGKAVLNCIESAEWREWFKKWFGE
jgi:hypothetical protein